MGKPTELRVGDTIWCIEGDDYCGILYMATCGNYVIGCAEYPCFQDDFDSQLEDMAEESLENSGVEVYMFRREDVFLTVREAEMALGVRE